MKEYAERQIDFGEDFHDKRFEKFKKMFAYREVIAKQLFDDLTPYVEAANELQAALVDSLGMSLFSAPMDSFLADNDGTVTLSTGLKQLTIDEVETMTQVNY